LLTSVRQADSKAITSASLIASTDARPGRSGIGGSLPRGSRTAYARLEVRPGGSGWGHGSGRRGRPRRHWPLRRERPGDRHHLGAVLADRRARAAEMCHGERRAGETAEAEVGVGPGRSPSPRSPRPHADRCGTPSTGRPSGSPCPSRSPASPRRRHLHRAGRFMTAPGAGCSPGAVAAGGIPPDAPRQPTATGTGATP